MQDLSRRGLLKAAGVVVGLAALPVGAVGVASATSQSPFRRSEFTPFIGKQVRLVQDGRAVRATLVSVKDLMPADAGAEHRFKVLMRPGQREQRLSQGLATLQRSKLKDLTVALVPVGPQDEAQDYEMVVNRLG